MKLTKQERLYRAIENHGEKLNQIFNTGLDNIELCKKLRRLENKAHRLAEHEANTGDDMSSDLSNLSARLYKLLFPDANSIKHHKDLYNAIFINGDPRGYALKIDDDYMRQGKVNLHRDWGGYGILAPDFNNDNS